MKAGIFKFDPAKEFDTEERCSIIELLNEGQDGLSIAQARVEPGVATAWHELGGTVERYIITEGVGVVEVGDLEPEKVTPGDVVVIPAETRQRITNTGHTDLLFLCICTPGFSPDCYHGLE